MICVLCGESKRVEERPIVVRDRAAINEIRRPLCELCDDQFHWRPSSKERRKSQEVRGSAKHPGYGYRSVNGRLIQIPEQIETIGRIIELRNDGTPWRRIAEILEREGRPTARGGYWSTSPVISIYQRECPGPNDPLSIEHPGQAATRYGWIIQDGELVQDEHEQQVIRWMLQRRAEGGSFSKIAEVLNEHGIASKRGGIWYSASVSGVVRREGGT